MIDKTIISKKDCTGCYCCLNACPKGCINMQTDEEGFFYPKVNYEDCIKCGKCIKVCPLKNKIKIDNDPISYACINKDELVRLDSSSGGIFTLLAKEVIDRGGVVFGATFNDNFEVVHNVVETYDNLNLLRGSKYVQSKIGYTYKKAKEFLKSGREVLFSGTPCQIAGLKSYLEKSYPNLITIDVICHGVPSPYVWHKYIEFRENKAKSKVNHIAFRRKNAGWKQYSISFLYKNNTEYSKINNKDLYMKAFLKDICLRPSCYNCKFRTLNRQSDITLADFWGVQYILPEMDDDKGTSLIILNSKLGKQIFEKISDKMVYKEVNIKDAVKYNPAAIKSPILNCNREKFFKDIDSVPFDKLVKKYCKDKLSIKYLVGLAKSQIKSLLIKIKFLNSYIVSK